MKKYLSEAISSDYKFPYYEKDGKKIEVKNFNDLSAMLADPDIHLRYGIAGLYLSYAIITGGKDLTVKSRPTFSIEDSLDKAGRDFVVREKDGSEIDRFSVDDIEATDATNAKKALSIIFKRGASSVNGKAESAGIKLVHITNFMFPLLNFNKTYTKLREKGRLAIEDFVKDPENIKNYISDTSSDWQKLWNAYCSKVGISQDTKDDLEANMTPDVFIDVITKNYGKKALSKKDIEDMSTDAKRIKAYIDSLKGKWNKKVQCYCELNSKEPNQDFFDAEKISPEDFVGIAMTPDENPNSYLKLVYKTSEGERVIISDTDNDLYYVVISPEGEYTDSLFAEVDKSTYDKIYSYYGAKKDTSSVVKKNELDNLLSKYNSESAFRKYLLKNILMFRFYYNMKNEKMSGIPHKMVYVNEDGLDLGSDAANAIANDVNGEIEKLREKYRDPDSEKSFGEPYHELTNESAFLTYKQYIEFTEAQILQRDSFDVPVCYSIVLESKDETTTYKFSQIKDDFLKANVYGIFMYNNDWEKIGESNSTPKVTSSNNKVTIVFTDKEGANKYITLEDDYDFQIDEKFDSVIFYLPTTDTYAEVMFADDNLKNKLKTIKPIE